MHIQVKRDDLIHPIVSGNKWRKLQALFSPWPQGKYRGIVSFGGGFSNHLHALGYMCKQYNIPFIAMVRGDYRDNLSPMLKDLSAWQSDIRWLTKQQYKQRQNHNWLSTQIEQLEDYCVVPEGGSGQQVHSGMTQLVQELPETLDELICPVASGGTLAGIIQAMWQLKRTTRVTGIAVLKGQNYLEDLVAACVTAPPAMRHPWQIMHEFHHGGYAKSNAELEQFCRQFSEKSTIPVEPVYSGKLFFALQQLLNQGYFKPQSKVAILHTGGLQGARV
ncbi:1-aminocyclopropane-1-carboxylate deaminase [Planctobacterium marinum]|uniref:1-aminocyclopropane-1-carboxylate deaminase n=1 Tax=Planctobacterium marinum TaxID=1631968 RepID=A0AA48HJ42_9ALTE|nr:1-aminocyclopropane-1-carboxylate deaminase [Planctobacterium marinum]